MKAPGWMVRRFHDNHDVGGLRNRIARIRSDLLLAGGSIVLLLTISVAAMGVASLAKRWVIANQQDRAPVLLDQLMVMASEKVAGVERAFGVHRMKLHTRRIVLDTPNRRAYVTVEAIGGASGAVPEPAS